jgi:Tfp pilus assembly protein PilN
MEPEMKTVISALVALVVGAGGMYFYLQGPMKELQAGAATLQTQIAEAKSAAEASAAEVTKLQEAGKALEEKASLADSLQAKVTELEAALAAASAKTGTGTAQ